MENLAKKLEHTPTYERCVLVYPECNVSTLPIAIPMSLH